MRLLFTIDTKDYDIQGKSLIRPSVRSIIIHHDKIALVHSLKYDYYKFPGGGIEANESHPDALIRETLEEAGLVVIPSSITEYGYVHRVQKSITNDIEYFVQDNYYYFCEVEKEKVLQKLDDYEDFEQFTLEFVDPKEAIQTNRQKNHGPKDVHMIEREAKVLEMLLEEGYFTTTRR